MWETYLAIPEKYGISKERQELVNNGFVDSSYIFSRYYVALAAYISKDYDLALPALIRAKEMDNYDSFTIYQCLGELYGNLKDTANIMAISEEILNRFGINKDTEFYLQQMINIYIALGKTEEAIAYLDKAIAASPRAEYWKVKGRLYEEINNEEAAKASFETALELDPNLADVWAELGRFYYNKAVEIGQEVNKIQNDAEYRKAREERIFPLCRQALTYYEKAYELDPNNADCIFALRSIYYTLGDNEKLKSLEGK